MKEDKGSMDDWLQEKALNSFVELAEGTIYAKQLKTEISKLDIPKRQKEQIMFLADMTNSNLYVSLYDAIKILTFLNNPKDINTADDTDEIWDKEEEGLANVLIRHGFSSELGRFGLSGLSSEDKAKRHEQINEILRQVKCLVEVPSRKFRSEINYLLLKIKDSERAKNILNLLEPVTHGEKEWETFQSEIQPILSEL